MDEQLREAIASTLKDSNKRDALAALITEYIEPGKITVDYVSMLLNARRLNPGDALIKKVRKDMKVRTLVPGAVQLADEITVSDRINYVLDGLVTKVMFNKWELDKGEIGTVDEIRARMAYKLQEAIYKKVFTALTTVWTAANTPLNYTACSTAVTATALEDAIDRINQTGGGVKAVFGVRSVMTPITKFAAFWNDGTDEHIVASQDALNEVRLTGKIGKYYGADLVAIDQVWNNLEDYVALMPTDKILVIGNKVGDFVLYGDPVAKVYDDMKPTPPYTYLELYQQFGMIIDNAIGLYVIKIT